MIDSAARGMDRSGGLQVGKLPLAPQISVCVAGRHAGC